MKTLLIAHRGDTVYYPENTMESFRSAFKSGADGIECDIHLHENKLVVVHDYLFDRNKKYPFLEDVLKEFGGLGRIEIEVKAFSIDIIKPLSLLLSRYSHVACEVTSSVLFLLPEIRKQLHVVSLGAIFLPKEFEGWMTEEFILRKIIESTKTTQANVAHIPASFATESLVEQLHKEEIKVHCHIYFESGGIADEVEKYRRFCSIGVDQCTFDDIALLEALQ